MKPRRLAVYGLTAGLLGGGLAGMALTTTTLASTRIADVTTGTAPSDPTTATSGESTTTTAPSTTTTSDPATTTTTPAPASPAPAAGSSSSQPKGGDWARSALDPLVQKGTITQAQEDAILAALQAARPDHGPGRGHGEPGFGHLDAAAQALGVTADELRSALQGGKSLADVAKAKGIDPAKVVDALVAELKTHLDGEVTSGEHTQAEADQILAQAKARITDFVNGTAPFGGPGGPGFGGHGPGGPGFGVPGFSGPGFGGPAGPGQGGAPANGSSGSSGSGSGGSGSSGTVTS